MKNTKHTEAKNILEFISKEDAMEFKNIASGRKFCKKGERIIDICEQEIDRFNYQQSSNIFVKIFKHKKFYKNKGRMLIENRTNSLIRAVVQHFIKQQENEQVDRDKLIIDVKKFILDKVKEYENNGAI